MHCKNIIYVQLQKEINIIIIMTNLDRSRCHYQRIAFISITFETTKDDEKDLPIKQRVRTDITPTKGNDPLSFYNVDKKSQEFCLHVAILFRSCPKLLEGTKYQT